MHLVNLIERRETAQFGRGRGFLGGLLPEYGLQKFPTFFIGTNVCLVDNVSKNKFLVKKCHQPKLLVQRQRLQIEPS